MKVIIQNGMYDLSLVYHISPLFFDRGNWMFNLYFLGNTEYIKIWLSNNYKEYCLSKGYDILNVPIGTWETYIATGEEKNSIFIQLAEKKSRNLYNRLLEQWSEVKHLPPLFPTFNIE